MLSIDQNCHSLWDVLPKLDALARHGRRVTHFIEDIDSAFTSLGSDADADGLRLARERFHRSGGADWGAALFYTEFLGRVPIEVRDFEPLTGLKTNALARQLGRSVDDLYDEFSPSDNWQLIGSSFVGDRDHHRVIGDLTVRETADFIHELLAKAEADMRRAFPASESQRRVAEWFERERALLGPLLGELRDARLTDLYDRWLRGHLGDSVALDLTSRLFACGGDGPAGRELLDVLVANYDRASALYNEAVAESGTKLRPLRRKDGELPLFATEKRGSGTFSAAGPGRADTASAAQKRFLTPLLRTSVSLRDGGIWVSGRKFDLGADGRLPIAALAEAGVLCLAGKAVVLVLQVRSGPGGEALALPYRGSLYMPAAHLFARKLSEHGLLPGELKPVVRVRLRLLDRLRSLDVPIRLPQHLAAAFGAEEIPARRLGAEYADLAAEAARRLEAFADADRRQRWQRDHFPDAFAEIDSLDARRRELAQADPKAPELRDVWKRIRTIQADLLDRLLRQIDRDTQVAELDYYDSRGAILPWCIALGGRKFYDHVLDQAEIYEEQAV